MAMFEVTLKFKDKDEERTYEIEAPSNSIDRQLREVALEIAVKEDKKLVEECKNIYVSFYKRL